MGLRLLAGGEGNSEICKDLSLVRQQETTQDESQGPDRQFLCGIEPSSMRGRDNLRRDQ